MDPVSVGLLVALAGGAGGEVGRQALAGLSALVRRPFRRGDGTAGQDLAVSSGVAELVRLEQDPADQVRAQALSTALAVRAVLDTGFRTGLEAWHEQAKLVRTGDGEVNNTVSGGTQHGPVLQGRDFSGLSFTTTTPPPPARPPAADAPPAQG
ncbi:hypothetical protein OG365_40285 (plasmid) [Streptomyces sp. NBC_00853]|uniref:hypothetical protein n=1 Tax=Streptomyces sp. NBC_00853 TaxID=2903681 RepID=UPI002F909E92|nr:hypothetical protein OG365_40285 [Streptomyces sp. NBC_00853]